MKKLSVANVVNPVDISSVVVSTLFLYQSSTVSTCLVDRFRYFSSSPFVRLDIVYFAYVFTLFLMAAAATIERLNGFK